MQLYKKPVKFCLHFFGFELLSTIPKWEQTKHNIGSISFFFIGKLHVQPVGLEPMTFTLHPIIIMGGERTSWVITH